jgi:Starch-binding associating with outer membrane
MKSKILIILIFLVALGSSCSKSFLNVDETNPNSASVVAPKLVLPAAETSIAAVLNNPHAFEFVWLWYGDWGMNSGYSPNFNLQIYNLINSSYQANWQNLYIAGENLDYIVKQSTDANSKPYKGMGITLKALIFQTLVDMYGDIPYSQAFQTGSGILKPAYDKQQTIYDDLVSQLDTAIYDFQTTPATAILPNANQDVIYGGDLGKWTKFANTLKLRMLIHQADIGRDAFITSHLTNNIGYIGPGDGALVNPGYQKSAGQQNPFWDNFIAPDGSSRDGGNNYYCAGQDAVDFFTATNDPRDTFFFTPGATANGQVIGIYYGQTAALPAGTTCGTIGPGLLKAYNQPAPLLTDFESLFLQAEAAERGWGTGTASTLYQAAVTASFSYLGVPDSLAPKYLNTTNPQVSYADAPNALQLIITQKWASLLAIAPVEVWTDYRRTGYPSFLHFSQLNGVKNSFPPIRLLYPQTEINYNGDNEHAAEVAAGGTVSLFTTKIFWQPANLAY